jgi:CRP-like cAMP-binding protein
MRAPAIKTRAFLSQLALFQEAGGEELDRIAAGTTELRVPKGHMLFQRGDPCLGLHAVVYGQVKLAFVSPQGSEKVVDIVGPGMSFGEALMFTGRPYVVYGQALVDSMLLHVSKAAIDTEIERDPMLARRMIAGLSQRLHGLVQDVEAYSLRSGMQRVIGYLLRDIDVLAEPGAGGNAPVTVTLDVNKGVIASRLNLTPEHFSRVLAELTQEAMIEVHGAKIVILDPVRIRDFLR